MPDPTRARRFGRFFWISCAVEAALLGIALALAHFFGQPLFSNLHWSPMDLLWGLIASAPLLLLFSWMLRSSLAPLARIRRLLTSGLRPLLVPWSLLQLAFISLLAGVCEEVLFRSVIQGTLSAHAGPLTALIISSALFGVAHLVTLAYAVIAAGIGVYFGVLWLWGDNLLIPITAHAAYDFVALVYLLRLWKGNGDIQSS
jgi:membrane protease YdiL (CAAX protease family)